MTPHIPHAIDTIVVATLGIAAAASGAVLDASAAADQSAELRLLLLPLIGAIFVGGGTILLNPAPETRRITIGRSLVALVAGVCGPQILALMHPSLASLALKPVMLVMLGGGISAVVYVLSRPFFAQLYSRAGDVAKRAADNLEAKLPGNKQ